MKIVSSLAIAVTCLSMMSPVSADVSVESPWVREAPPTAKMLASYMVLRNNGDANEILKSATAKGFKRVEIHRTMIKDGIASMEAQNSLSIPAKDSVALMPGGYHLMLIDGDHPLKAGESVELSLTFDNQKTLEVQAPVRQLTIDTPEDRKSVV